MSVRAAATGLLMINARKRFRAFISYSQRDTKAAQRLHRALENYRVPLGVSPDVVPSRRRLLGKFFRDTDDMSAASDISATVRGAIEDSESLIVICSPRSAQSRWVDTEIQHFRSTGRSDRIFAVIIDGAPNSGDPETESFPPSLQQDAGPDLHPDDMPVEPVGIDMRVDKQERVCARIAAGLLGVPFDQLWQRRRREAIRQWVIRGAIAFCVAALSLALVISLVAGQERRTARTRSLQLAEAARTANDAGAVDQAARYALAGLWGADDPLLSFDATEAEAELRKAMSGALLSVTRDPYAAYPGDPNRLFTDIVFAPDNQLVFAGTGAGTAVLLEARTGVMRNSFHLGDGLVEGWFSPDQSRLAMSPEEGESRIVDGRTGRGGVVLKGVNGAMDNAGFSPDGRLFVAATKTNRAQVWDAATGAQVADIPIPEGLFWARVAPASESPGWDLLVFTYKRVLQRYRLPDASLRSARALGLDLTCAPPHPAAAGLACIAPAEVTPRRIRATATPPRHAAFLVSEAGARKRLSGCMGQFVRFPAFQPDGAHIVAVTVDSVVCAWDSRTGALLRTWGAPQEFAGGGVGVGSGGAIAAFSQPADAGVAVVTADGRVLSTVAVSDPDGALDLSVNGDGALVAASTGDGALLIRDTADRRPDADLPLLGGRLIDFDLSADHKVAAAAAADGKPLRVWTLADRSARQAIDARAPSASHVGLSADGARLFTFAAAGAARILDGVNGAERARVNTGAKDLLARHLGPRETRIAVKNEAGAAEIWDVQSGRRLSTIAPLVGEIVQAAFSPDGAHVITLIAGKDGITRPGADGPAWIARVSDATNGRQTLALRGHEAIVVDAAFTPDDRSILTTSYDGTARLWDAKTGAERHVFTGVSGPVMAPVFSADSRQAAIGLELNEIALIDLAGAAPTRLLAGHYGMVSDIDFSPSGRLLVSAGFDETTRLWDTATGLEIARIAPDADRGRTARFLDEGRILVTGWQGELIITPVPQAAVAPRAALVRDACRRLFAGGGDAFIPVELTAMRVLDPQTDVRACDGVNYTSRVLRALGFARRSERNAN